MWESTERGYLTINNKPVITSVISRIIGIDITEMEKALQQMEQFNVFSRREDGAIFCRKMVRDEEIRQKKAAAGIAGMHSRYGINRKKKTSKKSNISSVISKSITNNENEIENVNKDGIKKGVKGEKKKKIGKHLFVNSKFIDIEKFNETNTKKANKRLENAIQHGLCWKAHKMG